MIVLVSVFYEISLHNDKKLLITIVDYRWNPIVNISVQLETIKQHHQEHFTNKRGQVIFYLNRNCDNAQYVQISAGGISERILPMDHDELTMRLNMINQDTNEIYDNGIFHDISI